MRGRLEVAGGGIAGLTVGLPFAREGWSVSVHEEDEQLRIPGAGINIWQNGLRVLEALGVLGAVSAGAIPATRHEKRDHDGRPFASAGFLPEARWGLNHNAPWEMMPAWTTTPRRRREGLMIPSAP